MLCSRAIELAGAGGAAWRLYAQEARLTQLRLDIGGLGLALDGDAEAIEPARQRYGAFEGIAQGPELPVHITVDEQAGSPEAREMQVLQDGTALCCLRSDLDGRVDISRGACSVRVYPTDYVDVSVDAFLRLVMSVWAVANDSLMVHGAGVVIERRGYGLIGKSGAGKSTISRLALQAGHQLLCDEITLYRRSGAGWDICGTPFSGELASSGSRATAPLEGVYLLRKSSQMRVGAARSGTELAQVARCVLLFDLPGHLQQNLLGMLLDLTSRFVPKTLHFRPEPEVWNLIT